jgi:hypothetical protein
MTVIVIADTIVHAQAIARELSTPNAYPTSPRAIRHYGACRGITATDVLVDDSAWPLSDDVHATVDPCLFASGGRIRRAA